MLHHSRALSFVFLLDSLAPSIIKTPPLPNTATCQDFLPTSLADSGDKKEQDQKTIGILLKCNFVTNHSNAAYFCVSEAQASAAVYLWGLSATIHHFSWDPGMYSLD